jgi:2-desacetyl-2-hydroxyethyl bacteriochlorophyllide A dehydrogenase
VVLAQRDVGEWVLTPDELLIETEFTFISAGTELANYTGKEPKVFQPGNWCTYPWKSGYSNVGIVRARGSNVTTVEVGKRVFTYGNHASWVRYDQSRLVIPVPEGIKPDVAAASRMAGVALTALIQSEIHDEPWVIVFGLGMVGNLAAQAFRIRGCRVIGVDPNVQRCRLAERCGIAQTISGDPDSVHPALTEMTDGKMGEIVVESVGHSRVVHQALKTTCNHGQLILLGSPREPVEGNLTELLSDIHLRWITLRGALEWCLPMYSSDDNPRRWMIPGGAPPGPAAQLPTSQYEKQQLIFQWIKSGTLKIEPLISQRLPPENIKEAYEGLLRKPDVYTGVALAWK